MWDINPKYSDWEIRWQLMLDEVKISAQVAPLLSHQHIIVGRFVDGDELLNEEAIT